MVSSDHLSESDGPELAALDPRVAPQAERRLGQYLVSLAEESDPGQVAWRLRGRSAEIIQRYVHPSVLHSVITDPRLLLTGAHAAVGHGCDLMPDEFLDAYVSADDIEGVIADHGLIEVDDGVNVRLRPVGDGLAWWRSLPENGATRAAPVLLVVADLSERDDARTALAAGALWDLLRNRIVRQSS